MPLTTEHYEAMTPTQKEVARTQYRSLPITEELLTAVRAAAQAKGSPLSLDELNAVYAKFEQ
jgi:hypothetical protein